MRSLVILLVFFLSGIQLSLAQKKNSDLMAMQYYELKEFSKANLYLEDLYDSNPDGWFGIYYKSLIGAGDFSKAERITKKQIKRNKQEVSLQVLLGRIYDLQGEGKKANETYEKAIKDLVPVQPFIQGLALAFLEDRHYEHAL